MLPSLRGVLRLIELYLYSEAGSNKIKLLSLKSMVQALLADKPVYRCGHCGFAGKALYWLCPGCKEWSMVKPIHGLEGD